MPRQNIVFAIVAPLVLMAIIAAIVIGIGEILLAVQAWAHDAYHIGFWGDPELDHEWRQIANIYPVYVALAIGTLVLVGGIVASRLAPQPKSTSARGVTHS